MLKLGEVVLGGAVEVLEFTVQWQLQYIKNNCSTGH